MSPSQRRCPFDIHGKDRSGLDHDSFDFNPDRWLLGEPAEHATSISAINREQVQYVDRSLTKKERLAQF